MKWKKISLVVALSRIGDLRFGNSRLVDIIGIVANSRPRGGIVSKESLVFALPGNRSVGLIRRWMREMFLRLSYLYNVDSCPVYVIFFSLFVFG